MATSRKKSVAGTAKGRAGSRSSGAAGAGANSVALNDLQQVLYECWELESKIQDIPVKIEAKKNGLKNRKAQYLNVMEKVKQIAERTKEDKQKLDDVIKQREEAEEKLERVSTQREFDSENAIAENCKREEHRLRVHLGSLDKNGELLKVRMDEMEREISDIEDKIQTEIDVLERELKEAESEFRSAQERKKKASAKIDQNLIYKFERIIRNKGGLATAGLKSGVCQGCHMQLPDQFVNVVRENKEIQFCPYCSRILVYEEGKEDEEIIESNTKYNDKRQSEEDEMEFDEVSSDEDIPEDGIDDDIDSDLDNDSDGGLDGDSDDDGDDLGDIAKNVLAESSLIADESEFDL
jgi:predicted  nucleic acid-binding Zn-ribbon protein